MKSRYAALALTGALFASGAHANLLSTFDSNAEGWTANTPEGSLAYSTTGGNTGGYIQLSDGANGDMGAIAPWTGNLSAYLGGTLSFDALNVSNLTPDWGNFGIVTISGLAGSVTRNLAGSGFPLNDSSWHSFSANLTSDIWGANLAAILADVSSISITTEFYNGVEETAGLDNIALASVSTPIPEPGSLALLATAGLAGLMASRRRRQP